MEGHHYYTACFPSLPALPYAREMYVSVTVLVRFGVRVVPWTVIETVNDLSFEQLFSKIKAGCFKRVVKND